MSQASYQPDWPLVIVWAFTFVFGIACLYALARVIEWAA